MSIPLSPKTDTFRVLLVDDDLDVEITSKMLIHVDHGLKFESASTPSAALGLLKDRRFDCVVLDYKLVGVNGVDFAREIRKISTVPIIIYTGKGSEDVAEEAFAAGVDDYIRKEVEPAHYQLLVKRIRQAIEKKRAEEALRVSEERYRGLLEKIQDPLFVLDDNKYLYANGAAARVLGYDSPEGIIGQSSFSMIAPDERDKVRLIYFARMRGEAVPERYELRLLRRDGGVILTEVNVSRITYDGRPASLAVHRDITESRRMEEALRESESRYRMIVENSPNAISVTVGDKIVYANRRRAELVGVDDLSQLINKDSLMQIAEANREMIRERRRMRVRGVKPPSPFAYQLVRVDGEVRDVVEYTSEVMYGGRRRCSISSSMLLSRSAMVRGWRRFIETSWS